ncbi:MAG: RNA 2',3'-cyclic phosphodiesterase [Thermoplasmata archaeon]|nr:RNA 2',3'-cyclic phosphodiesterase [Thermoplasmata archaeon]
MRAFFSVEIPRELAGVPPTAPDSPRHLTLAFLESVEDSRASELVEAGGEAVVEQPSFSVTLGGVGAFPSPERPRVVFLSVVQGEGELKEMATRLRAGLARRRFTFDRKAFQPHLTILRVRRPADLARARALLEPGTAAPIAAWTVDELLVKSSVLGHGGAVHSTIGRCALGPART